mmetsp:Transcript_43385/g.52503  ORF Transcript_43385/g.52503 Transcript_43385/m.52503 type:complete len:126 (-) Transcript_43385:391-768(-)|eukprot:CAMPEP_0197844866 /NCGR_PEP_ID=MMETSP1438-20131217/1842_1 /TAXON_ID=1461541 /ORGANISM="Pterosperma sp., Strain CCMP1384" /LENGTH=125 /DNA_ID=CAMNT_0043455879 /DNA_START=66 /DNA_END=443 /DNA_ORIENTATION=-
MQHIIKPGFSTLRSAVLSHVRVPVIAAAQAPFMRSFAADAGTYLDKKEVTERIVEVIKNFEKVDPSKVTPTSHFSKDLGLDSLDTVEVVMAFEEEFAVEIPDSEADKIATCEDAISYISTHPQAK